MIHIFIKPLFDHILRRYFSFTKSQIGHQKPTWSNMPFNSEVARGDNHVF